MEQSLALQPIGYDWFLLGPLDRQPGRDYAAVLAGEVGVKAESSRGASLQSSLPAEVRVHLTHLPLLGDREAALSHPADLAVPRPFLYDRNPAWWSELRVYQAQTARWAASRSGCIIAHDLGLGKTRTALAASTPPILVVCPKTAISIWQDECEYAGLRCTTLQGRPPVTFKEVVAFFEEHKPTTDVWLLNYHVAEQWVRYFCRIGPMQGIRTIICDEAHYLQKRDLTWTQTINGIEREQCILLTATPLRNRLRSLWSLLNTACPGAFGKEYEFRKQYTGATENGFGLQDGGKEWWGSERGHAALARLQSRLSEVLHKLTREQADHEVVPLHRTVHHVEVPRDVLGGLLDEAAVETARLKGGAQTIAWYTNLRHRIGLLKVQDAAQLVADSVEKWRRIVVWVWHDDVVVGLKERLKALLPDVPIDEILGKTSQKKRDATARLWKANKGDVVEALDKRILIGSIAAASQAVSFTTAGLAIFVELDWAPLQMQQAEKRTHRFGQIHESCSVVYCVLKGTIDETIADVLLDKAQESEEILGEDGQVDQMSTLLDDIGTAERETNEAFMQRVAAKLLTRKEEGQ